MHACTSLPSTAAIVLICGGAGVSPASDLAPEDTPGSRCGGDGHQALFRRGVVQLPQVHRARPAGGGGESTCLSHENVDNSEGAPPEMRLSCCLRRLLTIFLERGSNVQEWVDKSTETRTDMNHDSVGRADEQGNTRNVEFGPCLSFVV